MSNEPLIELRTVSLGYPNGALVAHELTLSVEKGEFVALLGPSGCGKTTLLRLLAGLFRQDEIAVEGSIRVFNEGPFRSQYTKYHRVGFVFENPTLLPWMTVAENASFSAAIRKAELDPSVSTMLTELGLGNRVSAYPRELSLGMQQRVALVRCLAHGPELALLDTPLSSLDTQTKLQTMSLVSRTLSGDRSVLFVTHDVSEAVMLADRILILGGKPTTIVNTKTIPLGRPRNIYEIRRSREFALLEQEVWSCVLD